MSPIQSKIFVFYFQKVIIIEPEETTQIALLIPRQLVDVELLSQLLNFILLRLGVTFVPLLTRALLLVGQIFLLRQRLLFCVIFILLHLSFDKNE